MSAPKHIVVIGGGLNGLTAAATLARNGRTVTLVEQHAQLGGTAARTEFHPGFFSQGILHDTACLDPKVVQTLNLEKHGLSMRSSDRVAGLGNQTETILWDRVSREVTGVSSESSDGLRQFFAMLERSRPLFGALFGRNAPDAVNEVSSWQFVGQAQAALRTGRAQVIDIARLIPQNAEDTLAEWIESPELRSLLVLPALLGTWMGPLSPYATAPLFLTHATSKKPVLGGPAAIAASLEAAARAAGVRFETGVPVAQIDVAKGQTTGVTLTDGRALGADCVLSCIDPALTLNKLVPLYDLSPIVVEESQHIRARGIVAKLHLAIRGPVQWAGLSDPTVARVQLGGSPMDIERAFDATKYGTLAEHPILDVHVSTMDCPADAPEGHHVVSILAYGVPFHLQGGWTASAQKNATEAILRTLCTAAPDIHSQIIGSELLTPEDLANHYNLVGGHLYQGEWAPDQLWACRPTPSLAKSRCPLPGLFLGGSGTHGGGDVRCTAGRLAAETLLSL